MAAMASLSAVRQAVAGVKDLSYCSPRPLGLAGSGFGGRVHCGAFRVGRQKLHAQASGRDPLEELYTREDDNKRSPAALLVAALAAGMLLAAPAGDALAAKSSGRVGGSSFRSAPRQTVSPSGGRMGGSNSSRPAPRQSASPPSGRVGGSAFQSAPRQTVRTESRTNVYVNPGPVVVAPPVYGYAPPFFGGGWGFSPFYSPAPVVAVGVEGGSIFGFFIFATVGAVLFTVISSLFRRND